MRCLYIKRLTYAGEFISTNSLPRKAFFDVIVELQEKTKVNHVKILQKCS